MTKTSCRDYKVCSRNSTVCGYPGRLYDWARFCWDGSEIVVAMCYLPGCSHQHGGNAPLPYVDGSTAAGEGNMYLHVAYRWAENQTVYRVRPNESMRAPGVYRGHKVVATAAIKKDDGWYWRLTGCPQ